MGDLNKAGAKTVFSFWFVSYIKKGRKYYVYSSNLGRYFARSVGFRQ